VAHYDDARVSEHSFHDHLVIRINLIYLQLLLANGRADARS
jgi:hypothetical protein